MLSSDSYWVTVPDHTDEAGRGYTGTMLDYSVGGQSYSVAVRGYFVARQARLYRRYSKATVLCSW